MNGCCGSTTRDLKPPPPDRATRRHLGCRAAQLGRDDPAGNTYRDDYTYDARARAISKTRVVPGSEGALAGSCPTSHTYNQADQSLTEALPAAGGRGAETVMTRPRRDRPAGRPVIQQHGERRRSNELRHRRPS